MRGPFKAPVRQLADVSIRGLERSAWEFQVVGVRRQWRNLWAFVAAAATMILGWGRSNPRTRLH